MLDTINYQTHNDTDVNIDGTYLQGYVSASYDTLKTLFGQPTESDGYKIDCEWNVEFDDGTVVAIYNWKNGFNYLGADGLHPSQINEWHVGGHDSDAMHRIIETLAAYREASQGGE